VRRQGSDRLPKSEERIKQQSDQRDITCFHNR
jgi:hypothetical protein